MAGENRYMVKLKDLRSFSNRRALNFVGVVVEFSVPRRTSGTDYCTILKIIDQYQQSPELSVNVFMKNIDHLPHFRAHKDIILLCDFKVESFNGTDYAVYDHKKSSFALFDGEITNEFIPYQASPAFHSMRSDDEFVRRLRNWSHITPFDAGLSEYAVSLKGIEERGFIDLVCKVLHVCEVFSNKWMLYVWDGTDAPAVELGAELGADELNPLLLHIEPTMPPPSVVSNFPCLGTVLRVIIDEAYENFGDHFKMVGEWVRIRNLQRKTVSGLWKGVWTTSTKIRPLSKNDNSVATRMRDCTERILNRSPPPTTSNWLTAVQGHEQAVFRTLMEAITSHLDHGKFKCIVRFLAISPSQGKALQSPDGEYRMKATLEDPTARIHASLLPEDVVVFFGGGHLGSDDALAMKVNKLLGVSISGIGIFPRNPPWTVCCVGFKSLDANDVVGTRHYYICDTNLV